MRSATAMLAALAVALSLPGCTTADEAGETADRQIPPPAADRSQPLLALVDHVLTGYFASDMWDGTTTCAATTDGREAVALPFEQEADLMALHVSLSPMTSCGLIDGVWRDVDAGTVAQVLEVHSLSCTDADHCTGFASATRGNTAAISSMYRMAYSDGMWSFTRDDRLLGDR